MRLGPQEVIVIIVIIIAAAVLTRIIRTSRLSNQGNKDASEKKTNKPRSFLRKSGFAFIGVGIILLLAGISMFKWALQSYMWSFMLIVIGLVIVLLFRKKG